MKKEQLDDYVWIAKGRKYWHVWLGNPFVCHLYKVPVADMTYQQIKENAIKHGQYMKVEFVLKYPDVPWVQ